MKEWIPGSCVTGICTRSPVVKCFFFFFFPLAKPDRQTTILLFVLFCFVWGAEEKRNIPGKLPTSLLLPSLEMQTPLRHCSTGYQVYLYIHKVVMLVYKAQAGENISGWYFLWLRFPRSFLEGKDAIILLHCAKHRCVWNVSIWQLLNSSLFWDPVFLFVCFLIGPNLLWSQTLLLPVLCAWASQHTYTKGPITSKYLIYLPIWPKHFYSQSSHTCPV